MNKYLEVAKRALEERAFDKLLAGEEGYAVETTNLPTTASTDINTVFDAGIYKMVDDGNREEIRDCLINAVKKLLDEEPSKVWLAFNACWSMVYSENKNQATVKVFDDNFIEYVKEKLNSRKEELKLCKEYDGARLADGLWEDISNANKVLVNKFGVSLL